MAAVVLKKKPGTPAAKKRVQNADPTVQTYRALAPLLVADPDGNGAHMRQFGDFVPEVSSWKNPGVYLRTAQVEMVYVNQSELDRWREDYEARTAQEDEEKADAVASQREIAELQRKILALQAKEKGEKSLPDFNAEPTSREFRPGKTREEKISFGGVKMKGGGIPHPVEIPSVTRAPALAQNTAENRTRPTTVRRVVRKKG